MVLSLIVGGIALALAYAMEFRKMYQPSPELLSRWEAIEFAPGLSAKAAGVDAKR